MNNHSAATALGIQQTNVPPSIKTEDDMILETPHQQRKEAQQESTQSTSAALSPEENTLDEGLASEGVIGEVYAT